jgi:hypothetical protein
MIWRYRLLILFGGLLVCGGLNWTFVVLVKEGRGFDDLETIQALLLLGGGLGLSSWALRKIRQLRLQRIDRHIIHLARNQSEIEVTDIILSDEINIRADEAVECFKRLARNGVGSLGVSEVGNDVFRLSDKENTIWLD